ncbi:hypothetical protein FLONG3_7857 [Fusarium longipes]|uniref:Heterokaryon incompatibility domain-containing protein n=1 Tax=Fusarium longipes TaxID=694270 RepID=A0A395S9X7_9HYPO|nr:hypothetical protein FLONG3_7857 [Fusarium longipes]
MRPGRLERSRLCSACLHACSHAATGCGPLACHLHRSSSSNTVYDGQPRNKLTDVTGWAKWSKTKAEFMAETKTSGCHLCILIAHAFDEASVAQFSKMDKSEIIQLCFNYRTAERDPGGNLDWGQRTRMTIDNITLDNNLPDEFWLQIRPDQNSTFDELLIDLRMRPLQETDTAHILDTVPDQHSSTLNKQNLELASKWIKKCIRSHPMCKSYQSQKPGWRPKRLVHVGSKSQQPRLVISPDDSGAVNYVALSYSWGDSGNLTLLQENIQDFQEEIPAAGLPNTMRDAIATTKSLGYEYIWIDALCIIQDSKEDWIHESSKMGDIYSSAAVTLAAAGTKSVADHMYFRRDPRTVRPCVANINPNIRYPKLSYPWAIYPNQSERLLASTINESPLSRRAWALQELLVSPRTLLFGQKQMVWSCTTTEASEAFPLGLDPKFSTPLNEATGLSHLRRKLMRISNRDESPSDFWNNFIFRYTRAKLTVGSDTLVALQGIVERIITVAKTGCDANDVPGKLDYVAGLWNDRNFQRSLLWRPKPGLFRGRPDTYRAPSWSWASLDGEIDSYDEYVPWIWNQKDVELASIEDISIEPRDAHGSFPTGRVAGGYIDMTCYMRPCHLLRISDGSNLSKNEESSEALIITTEQYHKCGRDSGLGACTEGTDPNEQLRKFANSCILDFPDEIPESRWIQVYCVPLQLAWRQTDRYEQSIWESYEGLVLIPTDTSLPNTTTEGHGGSTLALGTQSSQDLSTITQVFRRVGTFTFNLQDDNREAREDELFGPITYHEDDLPRRNRESIRVI